MVEVTDAIVTLSVLFLGDGHLSCRDAADTDDNGELDISDPIFLLRHLFLGGVTIPPPVEFPGSDPTADALFCFGP